MSNRQTPKESTAPPPPPQDRTAPQSGDIIAHTSGSGGKKKKGALAAFKRTITKGPRLLGRRVKHFFRDELHVDIHYKKAPPKMVTKELATLEVLSVYHRWLRGVQALLSIAVFIMSMMAVPAIETTVNWTIFVLSQCACAVIAKTYHVKAQYSGVTNVLFEDRNIFTSPYFFHMAFEIVLWNIQTPPIMVFWKPFFRLINYFIFLRLYSIIIYLNNAVYVYRTFCRAMAAISDLPLSTSFLVRTSMVYRKTRVGLTTIFFMWLTISFMYAKAEMVKVTDGMWFSFQTLATLGYGDFTPITVGGRAVAFIAWIFSFFIISYLIVVGQMVLKDADYNMQLLSYCHDLTHQLHTRSAWTIQVAWSLRKAQKHREANPGWKAELKVLLLSWKLTHVIAALRRTRQSLNANQKSFRETQVNPLTGLSAYQYNQFVYETHAAARRLQRVKDIDRVYLTLRDRDVVASSLSRKDIEEMIIPAGSNYLEEESALQATNDLLFTGGSGAGGGGRTAATGLSAEEVDVWKKKVQTLEGKISKLGEVIDALSAISITHPPSLAQSQV